MNLNNERGAFWIPIAIFIAGMIGLRGVEQLDRKVINKEKYETHEPYFTSNVREWRPKYQDKLKIETNDRHDANQLPPGYTVDTNYKPKNKTYEIEPIL